MEEPAYQCPGESDRISTAVHLARLDAGYEGCRECIWNRSTDGQVSVGESRDAATDGTADDAGRSRKDRIRRTSFGIRGAYLNAIDRAKASLLASVFVSQLTATEFENSSAAIAKLDDGSRRISDTEVGRVTAAPASLIVVGYDSDPNSPDLFTGVVQAVRQTGADVLDIGCCTAASLLDTVDRRKASGGVIVTSAEAGSGEIGLDVFDRQGQAVSVPWQRFGIRVRMQRTEHTIQQAVADSEPERFAQDLRRRSQAGSETSPVAASTLTNDESGELLLPDSNQQQAAQPGRRRRSGKLQTESTESAYCKGLLKWWQHSDSLGRLRVFCRNELAATRIEWLAAACSTVVEIHEEKLSEEVILASGPRQPVTVEIGQDDRWLTVWSRAGRKLQTSEIIDWLNQRLSRTLRHVTAHPADQFQMIRLLDVAGPDSGQTHHATIDSLAILGLLLTLNDDGRHPLPL